MKFKSHLASIMGVFALLCSANIAKAESDVVISVDEGVSMAQPIAVIPFKGSANEDVGQIIADDLRNSGKFSPIDRTKLPAQPGSASEVVSQQWTDIV